MGPTVTIVLALGGYLAKYVNDVRIEQRRARLDRVSRQLSEFYGPLLSLSYAGGIAWDAASADTRRNFCRGRRSAEVLRGDALSVEHRTSEHHRG